MGESNKERRRRQAHEKLARQLGSRPPAQTSASPAPTPAQQPTAPPAICSSCGRVFAANHIFNLGNHVNAGFFGVRVNCPYCGGLADIPDGFYTFRQAVQDVVKESTEAERALVRAAAENLSKDDTVDGTTAADMLERLGARWAQVAEYLRPKSGAELVFYLMTILEIIDRVRAGG